MLPPTPSNEHERLEVLERVLMNLVMNAGDAMPEGGTGTIATDLVPLDVESEVGHGSTFHAFLPSATSNPTAHA